MGPPAPGTSAQCDGTCADSSPVADVGVDRIADIIQTGRDHGLPTYTQVTRQQSIHYQSLQVFMENILT